MKLKTLLMLLAVVCGFMSVSVYAQPQPNICVRSCWGARGSAGCSTISALTRAIIHHTAGGEYNTSGFEASKSYVRAIQNYHMDSNGFCDIAYHFLVDKYGSIFEGRNNSMFGLPRGAHDGNNFNSFGFNIMGYFHPPYYNDPTPAMRSALYDVIAWRMPGGWSPYGAGSYNGNTVGFLDGHRKVLATACPGDLMHPVYITEDYNGGEARNEVNCRRNGGCNPPLPPAKTRIDSIKLPDGRQMVFGIVNGTAFYNSQTSANGGWIGWQALGGGGIDSIIATTHADGRPIAFCVSGNVPWYTSRNPDGTWTGWINMGGIVTSIGVGKNLDGRLELFGVGEDTVMYHNWQTTPNGGWSGWASLGGWLFTSATVANNADGRLEVFTINIGREPFSAWQTTPGGAWSGWASHGGGVTSLGVGMNTDGRLELFGAGTDSAIWHKWQTAPNSPFSGWASLGGWLMGNPNVERNTDGRLEVFANALNGHVFNQWQNAPGGSWFGSWGDLGGTVTAYNSGQNQNGTLEIFGFGTDNLTMWHQWQGAGWSGWVSMGALQQDPSMNFATVTSITAPSSVNAGQTFSASVVMKNTGSRGWIDSGANPHKLGSQNPENNSRWGLSRVGFAGTINPEQSATFTFNCTAPATPGTYPFDWKMVQEGVEWFGFTAQGPAITVTGSVPPTITTQPQSQTVNQGANATFSVVAAGSAPLSYQWRFNGVNISGATQSSYTRANAQPADAGNYSVVVSNSSGSVTSANAALTVNVPPSITTQPSGQTVTAGANVTFSVTATGTAPLSYQWRFNAANISGATSSSYTKNNVQFSDGGNYSVVVSNPAGSVTSANALLTVNAPPSITAQPQSQTTTAGANVTFSVTATGSAPLSYQWKFNGADIASATTSSLVKNNVQSGDIGYYSVAVSNPLGTVTSSTAVLSFSSALVFTDTFESGNLNNWTVVSAATALAISTAQNHTAPGANSALVDSSADKMYHNLGLELQGRARATFWIYDDSGTQTRWFGEARGYTGAGYGDGGLEQVFAIGRYSVGFGTGTGTLAGEVVNAAKYQGRVTAGANTGWFNLNANRSTGWHKFEIERAADGTTINFFVDGILDRAITAATFATWDSVVIGSLGSGTTGGSAWFDDVRVEYYDGPSISTQPASQTVNAGTTATLSVVAAPNISSYQWSKGGVTIAGATSSSLVFNNVQQANAGTYSVLVRNGIGVVTSANATLTVTDVAPSISTQPQSQTLNAGDTLNFTVVATGTAPLSYQWKKNAGNISGATNSSYSKSNVQSADAGTYTVVVTNPLGNVTSAGAVLTVTGNNAPVLGAIGNRTVNEGTALTFTATATDPNAGDTLAFSLDAGAPAGASIVGSSGAFSWTPTEAQGPGSYPVTVRVTDNGTPVMDDFETITVTVNEGNLAPVLTLGSARATEPVVNFESISDLGNDHVMFRRPSNSSSTSAFLDGAITNYTLVATTFPTGNPNAGGKVLKASWSFLTGITNPWLRLTTLNPVLIPNVTIDCSARLKFDIYVDKSIKIALGARETGTAAAIGANGGTTGAIEWLGATKTGSSPVPSRIINAGTWTTVEFILPSEVCTNFNAGNSVLAAGKGVLEHLAIVPNGGMGVYTIYVDNFEVVTTTALPGTVTMNTGSTLTFTGSSTDADLPAQTLTYSLDAGAPAGAGINSSSGAFSWTASGAQTGTFNITARVTDNGPGILSDPEPFTVVVNADSLGVQTSEAGFIAPGETVTLSWDAVTGATYQVQVKAGSDDDWTNLGDPITASDSSASVELTNENAEAYYRIVEVNGAASE